MLLARAAVRLRLSSTAAGRLRTSSATAGSTTGPGAPTPVCAPTPGSPPPQRKLHPPVSPCCPSVPCRRTHAHPCRDLAVPVSCRRTPPAPWLPSRHSYTESPTPPTSVPAPGTAEASFKAGSEFVQNHGKLLGGAATVVGVVAVVVGQVTASTVQLKAEVRRVEELHKVVMKSEARRLEDLTKVEARVSHERAKSEARRLEDLVKHEVAQRKEVMLRQAAQSEAANQKSEADMFRVLAGAETRMRSR